MRIRRILIFTVVLVLDLSPARVIFAQTQPPRQHSMFTGGGDCKLPKAGYGFLLEAQTTVEAGGGGASHKDDEHKCWVVEKYANGVEHVTSHGARAGLDGYYQYHLNGSVVGAWAEAKGQMTPKQAVGGSGGVSVLAEWTDTLTPHSPSMRDLSPAALKKLGYTGNPLAKVAPSDVINLTFELHQQAVQCSGGDSYHDFWYMSNLLVPIQSAAGPLALGGSPALGSGSVIDQCPTDVTQGSIQALNNFPIVFSLAVEVVVFAHLSERGALSGDVQAGRQGVSICIEHPETPSDLKLESASGNSYWCPNKKVNGT